MAEIYEQKTRWKWYLGVAGLTIVLISMVYTHYLVGKLKDEEANRMQLYRKTLELLGDSENQLDERVAGFLTEIQTSNNNIPVILTDERFNIHDAVNFRGVDSFDIHNPKDSAYIFQQLKAMKAGEYQPIKVKIGDQVVQQIFYKDSTILTALKFYPLFQLCLIIAFIGFGYSAFSMARRAEQNRVWAGMAKETAHQLGTPITAILAWIDLLKSAHEDDPNTLEITYELEKDVSRLELVADRFSKIGSEPELQPADIRDAVLRVGEYMQKRAPRKVKFDFEPVEATKPLLVNMNEHLFEWVLENLMRNALDALDGVGSISAEISQNDRFVVVDISDTGKGIPQNKFKTIFNPGYTTKKRGWGLGLSLAKRIIEEYHNGQIFVKKSAPNTGTTFTIHLPKLV
jgi:signal transduction histidine kinase